MTKRRLQLLIGIALALTLAGCPESGAGDPDEMAVGKLRIHITAGSEARSILPPVTMAIDEYFVEIAGPGTTQSATVDLGTATATFDDLAPGIWTVRVEGINVDSLVIAVSEETVTLAGGTTETIAMIVGPVPGQGSLVVNLEWPDGALIAPGIVATLTPEPGVAQDISSDFALDATGAPDVANYAGTWPAGYYRLALTLTDGGGGVWYEVAAVRIIDGATSIGQYILEEIDLNLVENGGISVNIGADLQNPYDVMLSGVRDVIAPTEEMMVTASLDPTATPDSYDWYLNGTLHAAVVGDTITIGGSGITVEDEMAYRLSLVTQHGSVLSSESVSFRVDSATP